MKKSGLIILSVIVVMGLAMAIIPSTRDEIKWRIVLRQDLTSGFESYLSAWPAGRHSTEAIELYDLYGWADTRLTNTVDGFENYMKVHSGGKYISEAREKIDSLQWQEASSNNTIKSYRTYLEKNPNGKYAKTANANSSALRINQKIYDASLKMGTEASLREFLTDYPGHIKESEVLAAIRDITEGRDIVDLIKEKKIQVRAEGSGIESVGVGIRRLVPYPITVRIPVGTFFVSANTSAQNMVTTAELSFRLESDDWQEVAPDAACANRPRDIPGSGDRFTVQRSPHQTELAKLMPILDKAGVNTETKQAAVWIVTDDADYYDLGTLVASQFGYGGSRVINEVETARALKICDEAGIDIKRKRIWADRKEILSGLDDAGLKSWLESKK
jgi:hypothetical protein